MDRKEEMKKLRFVDGMSLQSIANRYGISRERVRQIVGNSRVELSNRKMSERTIAKNNRLSVLKNFVDFTTAEVGNIFKIKKVDWGGIRHKKNGETNKKGMKIEEEVHNILIGRGIQNRLTNSAPVDIILENGMTIEVKSRWKSHDNPFSKNFYYFPINRKEHRPSFYVLVIVGEHNHHHFVIPGELLWESKGIGFVFPPTQNSRAKWTEYKDRFDIIQDATLND